MKSLTLLTEVLHAIFHLGAALLQQQSGHPLFDRLRNRNWTLVAAPIVRAANNLGLDRGGTAGDGSKGAEGLKRVLWLQ